MNWRSPSTLPKVSALCFVRFSIMTVQNSATTMLIRYTPPTSALPNSIPKATAQIAAPIRFKIQKTVLLLTDFVRETASDLRWKYSSSSRLAVMSRPPKMPPATPGAN